MRACKHASIFLRLYACTLVRLYACTLVRLYAFAFTLSAYTLIRLCFYDYTLVRWHACTLTRLCAYMLVRLYVYAPMCLYAYTLVGSQAYRSYACMLVYYYIICEVIN